MATGSKLGYHLNQPVGGMRTWPGVVTLLDPSVTWINEVSTTSPRTLIIARHNFEPNQSLTNPEQAARDAYAVIRDKALATKGQAVWQLYNETGTDSVDNMARLNRFALTALEKAETDGVKLGILASSTGTPRRPDESMTPWAMFLPSVRRAIAGGHVLLVHEYGPRAVMDAQGWHVGRFREARKQIPELAQVRTVVSEIGIDGGSSPYNLPRLQAGWRGVAGLTAAQYLSQLAASDALYADCPNVLGMTVFCLGGKSSGWASFAIDPELIPLLETYWQSNPPLYPSAAPPTTTPPPQPQESPMAFNTNPNRKSVYGPGAINALATRLQYVFMSDEVTGGGATGGNVVQATLQDPRTQKYYLAIWSPGFTEAGLLGPLG